MLYGEITHIIILFIHILPIFRVTLQMKTNILQILSNQVFLLKTKIQLKIEKRTKILNPSTVPIFYMLKYMLRYKEALNFIRK